MKQIIILVVLLILVISLAGCGQEQPKRFDIDSITTYKDIPGITAEEIAGIEEIKNDRKSLSYGYIASTEIFKMPDGSYGGFSPKMIKLFSTLLGIEFVMEPHEWDDLVTGLNDMSIDFVSELTLTPERALRYHMSHSIAERSLRIFTHADSEKIQTEKDIEGLRIGFMANTITADYVKKTYPLPFVQVPIESIHEAAQKIKSGEIDAFVVDAVADPVFGDYDFIRSREFFPLVFSPVSLATANPKLKPVISVIDKYIEAGGIDKLYELYKEGDEQYAKYKLEKSFTDAERNYLRSLAASGAAVKVAFENDNYPVCFYNKTENEFQGIAIDIIAQISKLTGIKFEAATTKDTSWAEMFEKAKTGEIPMVAQLLYSEARKDFFIWSKVAYAHSFYALMSKSEYPDLTSYQVIRTRVGVLDKSAHKDIFLESFPQCKPTKVYNNQYEGLDALERGEIDLLAASEYLLLTQTNYREKPGYKANIRLNTPMDSYFGFNKNEKILCSIIDKSQSYVKTNIIADNWTSRVYDYSKQYAAERARYMIVFITIMLLVFVATVALLIKNKRLSHNLEELVKKRTHELEWQTATLSTIYNSIPDLVFCKDVNSVYTSCNPSFEKFAGMSEAELVGKTDIQIFKIDEEMARLFIEADKRVLSNQNIEAIEELITFPDGTQRLMETLKTPLFQNGVIIGMMGISRDVTERKEAEERLARMSSIVNSSPQYISYINSEGKFDFFNPATHDITGYSYEELMANGLQLLYDDETNEYIKNEIMPKIFELGKYNFELPITRKDGKKRLMAFSAFTIAFDNKHGCGSIATDITERKQLEIQLVEAKELAEHNSRAKSEFLSRMSHEIRTPMNAIIGMTSIGKNSNDIERKNYCLDKIDSASTHLLGIINDVLDVSKIEAGKFELSNTDFSLERMLVKITNVINFRMEEKKQTFTVKVDSNVPRTIISDEQRLSQIITNLLSNAVKFTPEGGMISLTVRKIAEEDEVYTLQFEVKDTGIGISQEQQKKLFTSFEQADGSISRKYGGTGLGLAISKHIVEMMNGKIWIESRLGEGSSFNFNIRAPKGTYQDPPLRSDIKWDDLCILAVDDDEDVREYFLNLASSLALKCEVAASGAQACELIEKSGPFNIFFVDWKMEGMNGIELTKWIKNKYSENSIVIMISATEWSYIEAEAKQAGVHSFIPKPLFSSVLVDCINECLGVRPDEIPTSATAPSAEGCFEGKSILLAEDIEINREIVIALLEHTGIRIDCAENGEIAYRMFRDNPDYDMIFMDVHMPEVDGYTATRMIRALSGARAKTVPIIAMTANVFREDVEKCLDAGMNAHVGKPLDTEDMMAKLRQYLTPGSQK